MSDSPMSTLKCNFTFHVTSSLQSSYLSSSSSLTNHLPLLHLHVGQPRSSITLPKGHHIIQTGPHNTASRLAACAGNTRKRYNTILRLFKMSLKYTNYQLHITTISLKQSHIVQSVCFKKSNDTTSCILHSLKLCQCVLF